MVNYYGDPGYVKINSGVKPSDLGFKDTDEATATQQLNAQIEAWLLAAKNLIDSDREQEFTTIIPPCITDIANQLAINLAKQTKLNHNNPVERVDEYTVKITDNNIFTTELQGRLRKCAKKPRRWTITRI